MCLAIEIKGVVTLLWGLIYLFTLSFRRGGGESHHKADVTFIGCGRFPSCQNSFVDDVSRVRHARPALEMILLHSAI